MRSKLSACSRYSAIIFIDARPNANVGQRPHQCTLGCEEATSAKRVLIRNLMGIGLLPVALCVRVLDHRMNETTEVAPRRVTSTDLYAQARELQAKADEQEILGEA